MVKLKLIELASDRDPGDTVVAVAVLLDTFTTGVPVMDRLVVVAVVHTVPVPLTVILPVPKAITRAVAPLLLNNPVVNVNPLRLSVPAVRVVVLVLAVVKALSSCHEPPTPLKVTGAAKDTPLVDTVLEVVAVNVISPVADHTVPAASAKDPARLKVAVLVNVGVSADTVRSVMLSAPVMVTV